MTKFVRFTFSCLLALPTLASLRAADAAQPVVIERAPETDQSQMQEEIAALRAENQRISGELQDAQWALAEARTRIDELNAVKSAETTNKNAVAAEKARADEANARLATLVTGVEKLGAEKAALENRLSTASKTEADLRQQLTQAQKSAAPPDAAAKYAETERKLAEANERISLLRAENQLRQTSAADHARLAGEIQNLRQDKAALEARLAEAENRASDPAPAKARDELAQRLAETESKLSTTLRSYSQLQAEIDQLKSAASGQTNLAAELEQARQKNAELEQRLASNPPEQSQQIAAKLADVENRLSTTLRSYSQLQAESEKLKAAASEAADQSAALATLRQENAELKERLAAAPTDQSNELAAKLAEVDNKLQTTLRSYSMLQAENDRLKAATSGQTDQTAELEALRKEVATLEERIAANPTDQSHHLASKLADVEDRLSTALRSYTLLQRENDQIKAEAADAIDAAQASAAKAANEAASQTSALFDELRQTQASVTALASENAQLKTRLALVGSPPGSTLSSPSRPGSAQAIAAATPAPQPPAEVSTTPTAPAAPRTHVVALGDTLGKISRQYYGTPSRWAEIMRANPDVVKNENVLTVGTTLVIP